METGKSVVKLLIMVALIVSLYKRFVVKDENIHENSNNLEHINLPQYLNSTSSNVLPSDPPQYQLKDVAMPNFEQAQTSNYNFKELQESLNEEQSKESIEKLLELSRQIENAKIKSTEVEKEPFTLNQNNSNLNKLQPVKLTTDLLQNGDNNIPKQVEKN